MKWTARIERPKLMHFIIEYDDLVGYYLYAYENDINVADYLQDTLEVAKKQAWEDFLVPLDSWVEEK